jgi:hypothetical protein
MTTKLDTRLMPAQNPTNPSPTTGTHGEGVKAVALFESRRGRGKRAWDELSEIDRAVLLESVRQRRKAQDMQRQIYSELYGLRSNR